MGTHLRGSLLAGLLLAAPALAIEPGTAWHESTVTLLDVDFPATGFHARWEYFRCACGDTLLRLEQTAPDGVLKGEMLLVDGQAVVARGPVAESSDFESMLQAPVLMLQLAFGLMQRAVPAGPAALDQQHVIALREAEQPIEVDSGMATGKFAAPWALEGRAWPSGPERRRFELNFTFTNPAAGGPAEQEKIVFSVGQDFATEAFPLPPNSSLDGWRLQWISGKDSEPEDVPNGTTLKQLREQAKSKRQPKA